MLNIFYYFCCISNSLKTKVVDFPCMKEIGNTQLYLTVLFVSLKAILLHSKLTHLVKWLTI